MRDQENKPNDNGQVENDGIEIDDMDMEDMKSIDDENPVDDKTSDVENGVEEEENLGSAFAEMAQEAIEEDAGDLSGISTEDVEIEPPVADETSFARYEEEATSAEDLIIELKGEEAPKSDSEEDGDVISDESENEEASEEVSEDEDILEAQVQPDFIEDQPQIDKDDSQSIPNPLSLSAASTIFPVVDARKAYQLLIKRFSRELTIAEDPFRKAVLHGTLGELQENQVGDDKNALDHYRWALEAVADYQPALRGCLRLYTRDQQWESAFETIEALERSTLTDKEVLDLMIEKARILASRLDDGAQAASLLAEVLEKDPGSKSTFSLLEKAYTAEDDKGALIEFYERYLEDPAFTAIHNRILQNLARVQEERDHLHEEAIATYHRIIELDPGNLLAINALKRLLIKNRRWDELAAIYNHEARFTDDPKAKSLLKYLEARLAVERHDDAEKALELLVEGNRVDPENMQILDEMETLYASTEQWYSLIETHQHQLELTFDADKRVEIAFKVGALFEEKIQDFGAAAAWYERTLQDKPDYLPALHVLGKLYARSGEHGKLVAVMRREAECISDPKLRGAKYFTIAEHAQYKMSDNELAIENFNKVLELMPGYIPAIKALSELYAFLGRIDDLIEMNELQIANNPELNAEQYIYLLEKNASLHENGGGLDLAADCHRRILARNHRHLPSIQALGRLYARQRQWGELIEINQMESDLINDQHRIVSLLCKNGEIYEKEMGDEKRAIDYYRQVLTLSPSYLPAMKALGTIYRKRGQWDDLIKMYHRELEASGSAGSATSIRFNIAQIYDDQLDNQQKAETNYRQILEEDPAFTPALHALTMMYQRMGRDKDLIELYENQIQLSPDPASRLLALYKVAELSESRLHDLEAAESAYKRILEQDPENLVARRGLRRIYTLTDNHEEKIKLIRPELEHETNVSRRLSILISLADLYGELEDSDEKLLKVYRLILDLDPSYDIAFIQLERLLRRNERWADLLDLYDKRLGQLEDDQAKLALLPLAIDVVESHLRSDDRLTGFYEQLQRIDPHEPSALSFFESKYSRSNQWERLLDIYEKMREVSEDKAQLLRIYLMMGQLLELDLGRPDQALVRYQSALALDGDYFPAIQGAKRVYAKLEKWSDLVELLETEMEKASSSHHIVSMAYQLGYIQETKFNKRRIAADLYCRVIELDPGHKEAYMRAKKLLVEERQFARLIEVYGKRLEIAESYDEREDLHGRIADIAEAELSDLESAALHRLKLVEMKPDDLDEKKSLADLYSKQARWKEAIELYEQIVPRIDDAEELHKLHFEMGRIYQEELRNHSRAVSSFETVLSYESEDLQAMERLGQLYMAMKLYDEASEILGRLLTYELPKDKEIRYNLCLGEIFTEQLGQEEEAAPYFERALAMDPNNAQIVASLTRIFEKNAQWDRCVKLYQRSIDKLDENETGQTVALLMGLARIYLDAMGDIDMAIKTLEEAAKIDPEEIEVQALQAKAMGRNALYYLDAVDKNRQILQKDPFRVECYQELVRIFEQRNETDRAFCGLLVLDFLRALDSDGQRRLMDLKTRVTGSIAAVITPKQQQQLLMHPDQRSSATEILRHLEVALYKLDPVDLKHYNLPACKVAGVNSSIYHFMESAAYHLGVDLFRVYISQEQPDLLGVENTKPPTIVMGGNLAYSSEGIKHFLAGMVMSRIKNGHVLFVDQVPQKLQFWIEAACSLYVSEMVVNHATSAEIKQFTANLNKAIPKSSRKELDALARTYFNDPNKPDYASFRLAMRHTENRMGILLSGDLVAAAECLMYLETGEPYRPGATTKEICRMFSDDAQIRELLNFCVSEEFFELRKIIRIDVN